MTGGTSILDQMFAPDQRRASRMLLAEGYDYRLMAEPILNAYRRANPDNERGLRDLRTILEAEITEVRTKLRRFDRVMWFLRLWRVGMASAYLWSTDPDFVTGLAAAISRKSGGHLSVDGVLDEGRQVYDASRSLLSQLQHLFSLPVAAIQSMRFQDQLSVVAPIEEMRTHERAWQAQVADSFEPDPKDKPILRFKDGLAWWRLNREHCGIEGKAMGHCGNKAEWQPGDRLLSLRQSFTVGGRVRVKPYLTFVLRGDGRLGEMKGRFNQKPSLAADKGHAPSDFHDEIVALLRLPMIAGIRGGGHAPDQNFALSDLDHDTREALLADKPDLAGVSGVIAKHGAASEQAREAIREYIDSINLDAPSRLPLEGENYVIEEWSNLEDFCEMEGDDTANKLFAILNMDNDDLEQDGWIETDALDPDTIFDILEYMPDEALEVLAQDLTLPFAPANDARGFHRMLRRMTDEIGRSEWMDDLMSVVRRSIGGSTLKNTVKARIGRYIERGWWFQLSQAWLEVPKGSDGGYDFEAPVRMLISAESLADVIVADADGATDADYDELWKIKRLYGDHQSSAWSAVNWEDTNEHRGPYGAKLADRQGRDLMFDRSAEAERGPDGAVLQPDAATPRMSRVPREDIENKQAAFLLARRLLGHDHSERGRLGV